MLGSDGDCAMACCTAAALATATPPCARNLRRFMENSSTGIVGLVKPAHCRGNPLLARVLSGAREAPGGNWPLSVRRRPLHLAVAGYEDHAARRVARAFLQGRRALRIAHHNSGIARAV